MNGIKHIEKIREYCNYVEDHLRNVEKSWLFIQEACASMHPFYDDHLWAVMDQMIKEHDVSKMSPSEFVQYQQQFYPADGLIPNIDREEFQDAWRHHWENNPHHWENWTKAKETFPNESSCHCVCMVVDWMAMGLHFGDTAEEFYNRKQNEIDLPHWAVIFIRDIFDRLNSENSTE